MVDGLVDARRLWIVELFRHGGGHLSLFELSAWPPCSSFSLLNVSTPSHFGKELESINRGTYLIPNTYDINVTMVIPKLAFPASNYDFSRYSFTHFSILTAHSFSASTLDSGSFSDPAWDFFSD